jgi:hypothetical protein
MDLKFKVLWNCGLNLTGSCDHVNEALVSVSVGKYLDQLIDCRGIQYMGSYVRVLGSYGISAG